MHHVKVHDQCILCGEAQIDQSTSSVGDNELDDGWRTDVLRCRGAERQIVLREPGPVHTAESSTQPLQGPRVFRVRYNSVGWPNPERQHDEFMTRHRIHLCRWGQACTACDPECTINIVHVQCYKFARLSFRTLSAVDLLQLARLTRPLLSETFLPVSKAPTLPPPARLSAYTGLCYETGLGCLIAQIQSRLPVELQHAIFHRTRGLFLSLVRCLDTISTYSQLPHYAFEIYENSVDHPLQTCTRLRYIGLNTTNIMGETCIAVIGSGGSRPWQELLQLPVTQAMGLQTSYGTFGLVAIRILYVDGSCSPWMGGAPSSRRRFKTCKGRLEDMRVLHDGFKIIALELHSEVGDGTCVGVFWSDKQQPARGRTYSLIDARLSKSNVLGSPNSRVGLYLSLEGICSLTVFCTGNGMCSIQTNGNASKRFGVYHEDAVPLTFFFSPDEYIASVWALSRGRGEEINFGPCLIIVTSTGRRLYYGPHHLMFYTLLAADVSRFDQRGGKWRRPVGLFVDPTTATQSSLHSIGIALEENERSQGGHNAGEYHQANHGVLLPGTNSADPLYFPRSHWQTSFLTKTNLTNTKRLEVQTCGKRCVGLYIERHPGHGGPAILGQWDPADTKAMSVIYDADDVGTPPLSAMTFVFSDVKNPTGRSCINILVGRGDMFIEPTYTHDDLTQDIAWWFTSQHDFVETWQGKLFTIRTTAQGTEIPATILDTHGERDSLLSYIMKPFN